MQLGLPLQRGDEVLTTTQDYPSMHTAWRQRERRDGIVLRMLSFPVPHLMTRHRMHVRARVVGDEFSVIRVTPNVSTALEKVDAFVRAIETMAAKGV